MLVIVSASRRARNTHAIVAAAALALSSVAPDVLIEKRPPAGSLSISPVTPIVSTNSLLSPAVAALALSADAPISIVGLSVASGSLALSSSAPTLDFSYNPQPSAGALALSAAAPSMPQTPVLDSASAHNVTISGTDSLTGTNTGTTGTDQGAKILAAKSSGLIYAECLITTRNGGGNVGFGIGTDASTYANMGNDATSGAMMFMNTSNVYVGGSFKITLNGLGILQGERGCIAYDMNHGTVWFRYQNSNWNGSSSNNPATNTGGYTLPAGAMEPFLTFGGSSGVSGNALTWKLKSADWIFTAPSGFGELTT